LCVIFDVLVKLIDLLLSGYAKADNRNGAPNTTPSKILTILCMVILRMPKKLSVIMFALHPN